MTKTEERILKVWQEVFGREDFGIDDDFFELGGNSLMAMKLSEDVAGFEIDDFFECLSVRAIAKKVDGKIEQ